MISRLGFTIGIFLGSDTLIIDEILAVVDNDFRTKCINKIKELEKENNNLTILFVSHNMELVSKICKRGVVLKEGKIVYDGEIVNAISFYQNIRL
jgi:ABC-type polysaccharide/polyol phosphate transport system ATPase subunit